MLYTNNEPFIVEVCTDHCCMCIPGYACVEHLCVAPLHALSRPWCSLGAQWGPSCHRPETGRVECVCSSDWSFSSVKGPKNRQHKAHEIDIRHWAYQFLGDHTTSGKVHDSIQLQFHYSVLNIEYMTCLNGRYRTAGCAEKQMDDCQINIDSSRSSRHPCVKAL